jgi:hypothetical protein
MTERDILDAVRDWLLCGLVEKGRPDQPREPKGTPAGGQFAASGGSGGGSIDADLKHSMRHHPKWLQRIREEHDRDEQMSQRARRLIEAA